VQQLTGHVQPDFTVPSVPPIVNSTRVLLEPTWQLQELWQRLSVSTVLQITTANSEAQLPRRHRFLPAISISRRRIRSRLLILVRNMPIAKKGQPLLHLALMVNRLLGRAQRRKLTVFHALVASSAASQPCTGKKPAGSRLQTII
jgi:hypothetical protein